MLNKVEDISKYKFKNTDRLLIDANVWLFLNGPQVSKDKRVNAYSAAWKRILDAGSTVHIDVLIASEYINTCARLSWRTLGQYKEFKQFRRSECFPPVAVEIAADMRRILERCTRIDSGFDALKTDDLLKEYAKGCCDFNDQVLTHICKYRDLKIMTDDGDFKGQGIPVITANKKLLS